MPSGANIAGGAISGAGAGMMVGGPWGAVAGAVVGGVLGALQDTPTLALEKWSPADVRQGQNQFLTQGENIGAVSKTLAEANRIDNASFQRDASEFAPNLMGNLKQQGANTSALLAGQLSPGVQAALGKPGATARDLGLTSDQLRQQGASQLGAETKTALSLNPFNETATSTLLSPAALLQRKDQNDLHNLNIRNQAAGARFAGEAANDWATQALGFIGGMSPAGGLGKGIAGSPAGTGYNYQSPGGLSSLWGGSTNLGYSGQMPGTSQFDDAWYQTYGAESQPTYGGGLSNSYDFGSDYG